MPKEYIICENMEPFLRAKFGDKWDLHPAWRLSAPGESVPRSVMELLPVESEPLSKLDIKKGLELLDNLGL